jgi:hypothetical protein
MPRELHSVIKVKGKGKVHFRRGREISDEGLRYILLFLLILTLVVVGGHFQTPAALFPKKRSGTHFTGGWVRPRATLEGCEKSRLHQDLISGLSGP